MGEDIQLIDSHAHVYDTLFENDIIEVIKEAEKAGVTKVYLPNIDSRSIENMLKVSDTHSACQPMIGLHPGSVGPAFREEIKIVENWLSRRNFAAIGEIGLDLYWDKTYQKQQEEAFEFQIELALAHDLPIVIHFREAFSETYQIVKRLQKGKLRGIFHCFTGTIDEAKMIMDLNFLLGIGGVVTFKKSTLPEVLPMVDLQNIVLETDSPYLAPVPFRGKRNQPAYLRYIASKVAEIYGKSLAEISRQTSENASNLFTL